MLHAPGQAQPRRRRFEGLHRSSAAPAPLAEPPQGTTNAQCLFLLATAYFQQSKLKEAEAALKDEARQLIAPLRSNAAAHHLLGQIYRVRRLYLAILHRIAPLGGRLRRRNTLDGCES